MGVESKEANASAHTGQRRETFTLIAGGQTGGQEEREETCTNVLLGSGIRRRAATRLRVD